ncbi:MAG: nuclear transport factor 2 family protein [Calditrichaeota bacterium]|nr:nuclear transport factor 2 family protein [Calditrichota bacterium]
MNLLEKITDLNSLVLEGKALDAFDKYYADNCVMQENNSDPTIGKAVNREREIDFFNSITEFRGAHVKNVAVGPNCTIVEWHFDYTHKDWGDRKYDQIAVQEWRDGKIINEKFYYAN